MSPKGLCIKGLLPRLVLWGGDVIFKWWSPRRNPLGYLGEGVLQWIGETLTPLFFLGLLAMKYMILLQQSSCYDVSSLPTGLKQQGQTSRELEPPMTENQNKLFILTSVSLRNFVTVIETRVTYTYVTFLWLPGTPTKNGIEKW